MLSTLSDLVLSEIEGVEGQVLIFSRKIFRLR